VDNCNHQENKAQNWQGGSGTLTAAEKPLVLFISRVDPDTTQEEVEKFATVISKKLKFTVESLKQGTAFMPLSKLPLKVWNWKIPSAHTYGPVAY